ncbi:MAG: protein-L-isoaspartate(D-aspartate) O-methyltransferase [Proteobacteria bacterium]|nr:protein-L-isoaspartate(D-aspartate) O-methyltransferase [Pseudomonadota bacterium]
MQRMLASVKAAGVADLQVLQAMAEVPREVFLAPTQAVHAYDDICLPIGEMQTISMPKVVARMTELLEVKSDAKLLEIGTGCGYQTAILCKLARRVFTVERLENLSKNAVLRLQALGINNFSAKVADGTLGWDIQAPFDGIIVTAAGDKVPDALVKQLKDNGKLVIPVGPNEQSQRLLRVTKMADNRLVTEDFGPVAFVPLIGEQGVEKVKASRRIG